MLSDIRSQLRSDFRVLPKVVDSMFREEHHEDVLQMMRQVNGVTTYLSQMSLGKTRRAEATLFAAGVAGMDVVTDIRGERLSDGAVKATLAGNPPYPELEPLWMASDMAQCHRFDSAIESLARYQDRSMKQEGDPTNSELRDITRHKGGYSALAHLYSMKSTPTPTEKDLMMDFGHTMQLLDDYIDQPEDKEEGVSTLFTAGVADRSNLRARIARLQGDLRATYGDTEAVTRFGRVMRWHYRLGRLENKRPGTVGSLLPWYF